MGKEYDTLLKSISNAELAIIHCKESLDLKGKKLSAYEIENLMTETKELEKTSKSLYNQLISIQTI